MKRDPLAAKGNERGIEVEGIERLGPLHLWKRIPLRGTGHRRLRSRGVQGTRRRRATVKVTGDSSVTARNGPVVTSLRLTVMRSSVQRVAVLPPLCTTIHYSYSTVNPSRRSYITLVQRRSRFRRHGSRFRIVSLIKRILLQKQKTLRFTNQTQEEENKSLFWKQPMDPELKTPREMEGAQLKVFNVEE